MKKTFLTLFIAAATGLWSPAADFTRADAMISSPQNYKECRALLKTMLPSAGRAEDKACVLWRLSRIQLLIGETEGTKEAKAQAFEEGRQYAEQAIGECPSIHESYMWHCANVGRACQLKPLLEQASAVPVMTRDLTTIIDGLARTECSEAWQALAEIYYNHPFKSTDSAINFTRKALSCIPEGELRLSSYAFFAKMLLERGASADKRAKAIEKNAAQFSKSHSSAIDKFAFYDGSSDAARPAWSEVPISALTDEREAEAVLKYAADLYRKAAAATPTDKADFETIKEMLSKIK